MFSTLHRFKLSHFLGRNLLTDKFLPFRFAYHLIRKFNYTKVVQRNGNDVTILIKNGTGIMNFVPDYEDWLDWILPALLVKPDAVFVDIGANIGQTMLKVMPRFPETQYYAIEPNDECVDYLEALCQVNKFKSVKIFKYALSNTNGEAELLVRFRDDMLATTTHSFRKFTKYARKNRVQMTTGDTLLRKENLKSISVIKMDIEGGEAKAIDGLLHTIANFQPYIICEIAPLPTEDKNVTAFRTSSAAQILSRLSELNYTAVNLITGKVVQDAEDLSESLSSCNYLFVPHGKESFDQLSARLVDRSD